LENQHWDQQNFLIKFFYHNLLGGPKKSVGFWRVDAHFFGFLIWDFSIETRKLSTGR
jgi:hypothetical protein